MRDRDWNEIDIDFDAPGCDGHCPCPACAMADAEERRLKAAGRLPDDDEMIDLGALASLGRKGAA